MDFSKKRMKSSPDNENNNNNTEQGRLRIWLRESSPSLNPLKTMFGPSGLTEESGSQFCWGHKCAPGKDRRWSRASTVFQ